MMGKLKMMNREVKSRECGVWCVLCMHFILDYFALLPIGTDEAMGCISLRLDFFFFSHQDKRNE